MAPKNRRRRRSVSRLLRPTWQLAATLLIGSAKLLLSSMYCTGAPALVLHCMIIRLDASQQWVRLLGCITNSFQPVSTTRGRGDAYFPLIRIHRLSSALFRTYKCNLIKWSETYFRPAGVNDEAKTQQFVDDNYKRNST